MNDCNLYLAYIIDLDKNKILHKGIYSIKIYRQTVSFKSRYVYWFDEIMTEI